MIKFETKDRANRKNRELYKRRFKNGRSAVKCYEYLELVNQENKKEAPNATKMRHKKERQLLADLFKDEGLTEEDVLNKMSTKTYTKALKDIFREINGEDEEDSETEPEEMGKRQKNNLNKRYTFYRTLRKYNVSVWNSMGGH
ncbi:phage tail assembly chaperone G [Staphylococcus aureus]